MRKRRRHRITCLSLKRSYCSRDEARVAAHARLNSAGASRPAMMRVYKCRQCAEWHLTSQRPEVRDGKWNGLQRVLGG